MTLSVRLPPLLTERVEQESRRLGITKSELVKDALERMLGLKDPYALLLDIRRAAPMGDPLASQETGQGLRKKLRANRTA